MRERELAVRAALGANQWRLIISLLTEAFLLTAVSTLSVGLALAWIGIQELQHPRPIESTSPRSASGSIRSCSVLPPLHVLAATAMFGMPCRLGEPRSPESPTLLRGSGRNAGLVRGEALYAMPVVMVEVALSFVLLVGAGLMFRSFLELQRVDPGFDPLPAVDVSSCGERCRRETHRKSAAVSVRHTARAFAGHPRSWRV